MKSAALRVYSAVLLLGAWGLALLGLMGHPWAWNVFIFMMWTTTIIEFIALFAGKEQMKLIKTPLGKQIPAISDVLMAFVMAAFSHFGYATMCILQLFAEQLIYQKAEEARNENSNVETPSVR